MHCLLAPVALTLLPLISLSVLVEDLVFHQLMLWIVVPTSIVALSIGCRKHRRWPIALSGALGLVILFGVAMFGHETLGINGEKIITSLGGILLALSHYLNYRACQSITCNSAQCGSEHHH